MKLQVDILPSELGCFDFPRVGYLGGKNIHLGSYKFMTQNDQLILDIDRCSTPLNLNDENLFQDNGGSIHQNGNWKISGTEPGKLEIREACSERVVCPTEGTLNLSMK
jgi:hypothetical protein